MFELCADGGCLVASFPRWSLLKGPVRKVRYEWIGDCPIFNYSHRELELLLGASGFEPLEIATGRSGHLVRAYRPAAPVGSRRPTSPVRSGREWGGDKRARDRLLGLHRPDRLDAGRLRRRPSPLLAAPAGARPRPTHPRRFAGHVARRRGAPGGPSPSVSLIVAAHDEQDVIAAKVANSLALEHPRARADRRLRRLHRRNGRPRPRRRGRRRARVAPRRQGARPGRRRRRSPAARSWPSRTPTRCGSPMRSNELLGAFSDPRVGYACGQVRLRERRRGRRARRGSTGATRWPCARTSRACARSPAATARSTRSGREAYVIVDPIMGHDLSFPFKMVKRGLRAVYVPSARSRARRWSPRSRASSRASAA